MFVVVYLMLYCFYLLSYGMALTLQDERWRPLAMLIPRYHGQCWFL